MNVLLMAYGTPYAPEEVEPYYTDIRRGRRPSEELLKELAERYEAIGKSPLNEITLAQAVRLQALLNLEAPPYPKRPPGRRGGSDQRGVGQVGSVTGRSRWRPID